MWYTLAAHWGWVGGWRGPGRVEVGGRDGVRDTLAAHTCTDAPAPLQASAKPGRCFTYCTAPPSLLGPAAAAHPVWTAATAPPCTYLWAGQTVHVIFDARVWGVWALLTTPQIVHTVTALTVRTHSHQALRTLHAVHHCVLCCPPLCTLLVFP